MRFFNDAIKGMVIQRDAGQIHTEPLSGTIHETFKSTAYAPTYTVGPDGTTCDCSRNSSLGICRHKIYHRYIASTASETPVKLFSVGIVKQVLVQLRHRHKEDTVDTVLIPADRPESPDLDVLQQEMEETTASTSKASVRNEPASNIKYNEMVDQCVLTAELVANHSGSQYTERNTLVRNLNQYLRDGFPPHLLDAFNNPQKYTISPAAPVLSDDQILDQVLAEDIHDCFHVAHQQTLLPPEDDVTDDHYMFPAHIFAQQSSPVKHIAAAASVHLTPTTPHEYTTLQTANTPNALSALKFHESQPEPGRPNSKRKALFGAPSTPHNKRVKSRVNI